MTLLKSVAATLLLTVAAGAAMAAGPATGPLTMGASSQILTVEDEDDDEDEGGAWMWPFGERHGRHGHHGEHDDDDDDGARADSGPADPNAANTPPPANGIFQGGARPQVQIQ